MYEDRYNDNQVNEIGALLHRQTDRITDRKTDR